MSIRHFICLYSLVFTAVSVSYDQIAFAIKTSSFHVEKDNLKLGNDFPKAQEYRMGRSPVVEPFARLPDRLRSPFSLRREHAPADLSKYTECSTRNFSEPYFKIGNESKRYKSSGEIEYDQPGWEERLPVEWEGLNFRILGYPGVNVPPRSTTPSHIKENVRIAVVDVRMVNGKPHHFYLSNSTALHPIENWSSTKVLSIFTAAHYLRVQSGGQVGMGAFLNGAPLGRFVTSIASLSDNQTAAWFKTVMGPRRSSDYLLDWIGKSDLDYNTGRSITTSESFAGRWGASPIDTGPLSTPFVDGENQVEITRDLRFRGNNSLSPLTHLEVWKRVLVGEKDSLAYEAGPKIQKEDLEVILYGEKEDRGFGGLLYGGSKNESFSDEAGGKRLLDRMTAGRWRIFGKTGSSGSGGSSRGRAEATRVVALCLPQTNDSFPDGRELYFFVNVQARKNASVGSARRVLSETIKNLIEYMVPELRTSSNEES